jgi:hypothetical protein
VSQTAVAGRPLTAVRRQLHALGLHVRVAWRHDGQQPPGTVLWVSPAGRLPAGTTVLVTAALPAHGHHHGKKHDGGGDGQGNGNGQGRGDGQGNASGD